MSGFVITGPETLLRESGTFLEKFNERRLALLCLLTIGESPSLLSVSDGVRELLEVPLLVEDRCNSSLLSFSALRF
jgi:hypothetical protein